MTPILTQMGHLIYQQLRVRREPPQLSVSFLLQTKLLEVRRAPQQDGGE
jgi:hypothetical protein